MCEAAPGPDAGPGPDGAAEGDAGADPDAATPRCEAPGTLALGAGIPTNLGGSIATVTDLDGDGMLELVSFSGNSPREVRVGTWSGAGLDGPGRQLVALPELHEPLVGVEENGMPVLIGSTDGDPSSFVAIRYAPSGYESHEVRWFPMPGSAGWYRVTNGVNDFSGFTFARLFESRSLWAKAGAGGSAPLYRFVVESDHVRGEQVDGPALFGADYEFFALLDGDVNADGVEDVLIFTRDTLWLGMSGPGGTWTRTASLAMSECGAYSGHRLGLVADLDQDGDRDLVLALNCTMGSGGFLVALTQDDGSHQFIHHGLVGEALRAETAALGDLDGDCYPDLLLSDGRVARNDGTGRFLEPVLVSDEAVGGMATLADLDSDGDLDVIWSQAQPESDSSPIVQLNMLR
ncbi:MAG: VCBS repeat-containing protein [Sandaracinaceae bacterium]